MRRFLLCLLSAALTLGPAAKSPAQITVYHDRTAFLTALSGSPVLDDFESYPLGDIPNGDVRGDFRYTFNPSITQAAVVPDGAGGQALGGSPFDVFVGGDSVTLSYVGSGVLRAFGADFAYAPSFDAIPADTYRLTIADGSGAGASAGNLDSIDPNGGTFFLGLIGGFGFTFSTIDLSSVQMDPNFLAPAYQADNLTYAAVPEPLGSAAGAIGVLMVGALLRVYTRRTRARL